jgi:hypothetical protein
MATVYVVTTTSTGFNLPIAVFSGVKYETLERRFLSYKYMIDELDVEKNLKEWPEETDNE